MSLDPSRVSRVITTWIVTKLGSGSRFTFSHPPDLTRDLPADFAEPGETVQVTRRLIAEENTPIMSAVRTSDTGGEGYTIREYAQNYTYKVTFPDPGEPDESGEEA
jgi:hypothetical protein